MAKSKVKSYNAYAQQYANTVNNAREQTAAFADAVRKDGGEVSEQDEQALLRQFLDTGEFDLTAAQKKRAAATAAPVLPSKQADFSGVSSEVDSTAEEVEPSFGRRVATNLLGDSVGNAIADAGATIAESTKNVASSTMQGLARSQQLNDQFGGGSFYGGGLMNNPIPTTYDMTPEERVLNNEANAGATRMAAATAAQARSELSRIQQQYPDNSIGYHLMGVANSVPVMAAGGIATMAAGPAGGGAAVAALTGAQQYSSDLEDNREEGDAIVNGIVNGTLEGAMDTITFGLAKYGVKPFTKFLSNKFGARQATELLVKAAASTPGRLGIAAAEGVVTEPLTSVAQRYAADTIYNEQSTADDYMRDIRDSMIQGGVMSGGMYAAGRPARARAERLQLRDETINAATETGLQARFQAGQRAAPAAPVSPVEQSDLFGTPDNLPSTEEYQAQRQRDLETDAAYSVRNKQQRTESQPRVREQRREEVRSSIQNRVDTARDRVDTLRDQIESGATDSATLNAATAANRDLAEAQRALDSFDSANVSNAANENATTPETSVEATPPEQQDLFTEQEQTELAQQKQQELADTKAAETALAKQKAAQDKAAKAKESKLRNDIARRLLQENPGKTPAELAPQLRAELAAARAPAQVATPAAALAPRAAVTPTQTQPAAPAEPVKNNKDADAELREMLRSQGMNIPDPVLDQTGAPRQDTADTDEQYVEKAKTLINDISRKGGKDSKDIQNLLKQGKLVLASNPSSVNRTSADPTGDAVAQYDTQEGKMYMYMDRLQGRNPVAAAAAALHEATHAGQFNDRQGRPDIYVQMMSQDGANRASQAIRAASRNGNKLASNAVRRAAEANPDARIQDLELVPYFVTEAVESRAGTFGRLNGVVKDIKSGARNFLRKAGLDLDLSLDDINSAAQGVAGEVAQTELRGNRDSSDNLSMIAGPTAGGFSIMQKAGRTYRGRADAGERFEIPDAGAELAAGYAEKLRQGSTLGEVLEHDKLYANYPDLRDMPIRVEPTDMGVLGFHDNGRIGIADHMLARPEDLRKLILHETQHAVQSKEGFVAGANSNMFRNNEPLFKVAGLEDDVKNAAQRFDFGAAQRTLNPQGKSKWDALKQKQDLDKLPRLEQAGWFLEDQLYQFSSDPVVRRQGERYTALRKDLTEARQQARIAEQEAFQKYLRDYGETEARNTEFRSRMDPDVAAQVPPETTMQYARGNIPVEQTTDNRQLMGQRVASQEQRPTSDSIERNNQDTNLSKYADTLYREVDADNLIDILPYGVRSTGLSRVYLTDNVDLATGQNGNQGYLVEFDPSKMTGSVSTRKPAWKAMWDSGSAEYITPTSTKQSMMRDAITKITIKPDAKVSSVDRAVIGNALRKMLENGWTRTDNADGSRTYTKPVEAAAPVSSLSQTAPKSAVPEEQLSAKEHLYRILQKGTQHQTADIKIAEDFDTRYRNAMKQDVGRDYDRAEVHKEITDALTSIDTAPAAEQVAKWDAFMKKYPNVGPIVRDMRAMIDRQTNDYIQNLMGTGRVLSEKEIKDVQTMLANRGKYLTRAYSAFQRGIGRKWAENRWADYKNNIEKYAQEPGRLPPQVRENVEAVVGALQYMQKHIVIPDNSALLGMDMSSLESMYEDHVGPVNRVRFDRSNPEAKRAVLVQGLADRRESMPESEINAMAERSVKEMLGLSDSSTSYSKILSDLARDPGTLKTREQVPPAIKKLLGEITDPGGVVLSTMTAQAGLNARMGVYKDLLTTGVGTHIIPANQVNEEGAAKKFTKQLKGEQYGPLEGYYATPAVYDALTDQIKAFYTYSEAMQQFKNDWTILASKVGKDAGRALGKVTRLEKMMGVVYTPFNWAGNALGSPFSMVRAGNLNPVAALKGMRTSVDYVSGTMWNTTTEALNDAIRYVNIESVDVSEMQNILGDKMKDYLDGSASRLEAQSKLRKYLDSGKRGGHRVNRSLLAGYSVLDNWTKIANFYDRANTLEQYYKAAGENKTKAQILQEAGHVTSYTNLSPERVHSMLRTLESNGITKFLPYFSEVFRTTLTNYNQGLLDLQRASQTENPKAANIMRNAGMRRIIGNTMASIALPSIFAIPALGFMLPAGGDDEEKKKRHLIGEFSRFQDLLQFGKDKNGMPVYMAVSTRLDPHGPATDLVRMMINTEDNKQLFDNVSKYLTDDLLIAPSWLKAMYAGVTQPSVPPSVAAETIPGLAETLQSTGADPVNVNKVLRVFDGWLPGILKAQAPYSRGDVVGEDAGTVKTLNWLGARFETLNPQQTLTQYNYASREAKNAARSTFNDNVMNAVSLKEQDLVRWATEFRAAEFDRLLEDYKNVESMRAWGFTDDQIGATMKNAKWSKADIDMLLSGQAMATLSKETLKNAVERKVLSTTDGTLREKYEARLEEANALIDKNKDKFSQMGIIVKDK